MVGGCCGAEVVGTVRIGVWVAGWVAGWEEMRLGTLVERWVSGGGAAQHAQGLASIVQ